MPQEHTSRIARANAPLQLDPLGPNNFDLVRLFAATQVALLHSLSHLQITSPVLSKLSWLLSYFPGVPVFFFVSGFLITRSCLRASLRSYVWNRILRIYPALGACFLISLGMVFVSGYFVTNPPPVEALFSWITAQLTVFQPFNPAFMRSYGIGVLNGSLWTIPVEIQFYIILPIFFILFGTSRKRLSAMALVFFAVYILYTTPWMNASTYTQLVKLTFIPWIGLFLMGALASVSWTRIRAYFEGKFVFWLTIFISAHIAAEFVLPGYVQSGNLINFPVVLLLGLLTLSAAFTKPTLSTRLLANNDISYGMYIYHMPVVNLLIYLGIMGTTASGIVAMSCSLVLATASWSFIERPALRLKKNWMKQR